MTWANTPPMETGLFWYRDAWGREDICYFRASDEMVYFLGNDEGKHFSALVQYEWWPHRIEPPKECVCAVCQMPFPPRLDSICEYCEKQITED